MSVIAAVVTNVLVSADTLPCSAFVAADGAVVCAWRGAASANSAAASTSFFIAELLADDGAADRARPSDGKSSACPQVPRKMRASARNRRHTFCLKGSLRHDPEKWVPVFGKDHAQKWSWRGM